MRVQAKDLRLADVVQIKGFGPWNHAIVKQVTDTQVHLFRPYGSTADFSYTRGVICYVGIEEYSVPRNELEWTVLDRKDLK
jgi:hypothetical protein